MKQREDWIHHPNSPSQLGRRLLCPPSGRLEKGRPRIETDDAAEGTLLHKAMSGADVGDLTEEQDALLDLCHRVKHTKIPKDAHEVFTEKHVQLFGPDGKVLTEGTLDFGWILGDQGGLLDYKFGRLPLSEANCKMQAAGYAGGLMQKFRLSKVWAGVYQPRTERLYSVEFDSLDSIIDTIQRVVAAVDNPKAEFNPSLEACTYCRALLVCNEAHKQTMAVAEVEPEELALTGPKLGEILEKVILAEKRFKGIREYAKNWILDGNEVPGFRLQRRRGNRFIKDVGVAFERAAKVATEEEIMGLMSLSYSTLWRMIYDQNKGSGMKKEEIEETLLEVLGDCVDRKPEIVSLMRIPKRPKG